MFAHKARGAVIVLTILTLPAPHADACEFLRRCFGGGSTAYYAPQPACAPACCPQPCCPQPTVSYMPQTCYRTVYANVPVVAYRPMTSCDPCTGCATTVMRPVTSYVMQPRVVPYTSYRPVVTANYAPACATGFAPAATTVAYPSVTAYANYAAPAAVAAPPACCSPNTAAPSISGYFPAPAPMVGSTVTSLAPAPAYAAPTTSAPATSTPMLTAPSTSAPSTSAPPQTFEQPSTSEQGPESRLMQPLQLNPSTSNSLGAPRALDPESQDRMTSLPLHQAFAARPVSTKSFASESQDDGGWRASRN